MSLPVYFCVSPCAFEVFLLGFLLASLSWFEVLQDEGVRLSAPLRHCAQKLKQKHEDQSIHLYKAQLKQ